MDRRTQDILSIFEQISSIPRCSKHEERIAKWLKEWAVLHGLSFRSDSVNNVVITAPPSSGYEKSPTVVIQGHMDMVCEKTGSSIHDFSKEPIKLIYEGDWLRAETTTLGADNGIALAIMLELAQDRAIPHPPLELLFTVDEETSMQGANVLTPDMISGKVFLNLDSEEEGVFIVGCAGGITTSIEMGVEHVPVPKSYKICRLIAEGMAGGHSGVDIHEKRANANKVLAMAIEKLLGPNILLLSVDGGKAHNAIPRYAQAFLAYPNDIFEEIVSIIAQLQIDLRSDYIGSEPELTLRIEKGRSEDKMHAISPGTASKFIRLLLSLPHGVASMSPDLPDLVETSSNLATIKTSQKSITIVMSQRSSDMEKLALLTKNINALARSVGATIHNSNGYPSWKPNMMSPLLQQCKEIYSSVHCKTPQIKMIHAGLECAVIGSKFVGIDMISFGPTIKNPHSPDERLYIPSVLRTWEFLAALLASFK
ncbi:aminoacyl-histidine dipeptidase [Methanomethylovorans sp.]|uniref:aminoacyl-histidine dipeptidase n=1 Tax=Methanomethylovorans sp. TaxID=2758717 RepID=UPI00345E6BC2